MKIGMICFSTGSKRDAEWKEPDAQAVIAADDGLRADATADAMKPNSMRRTRSRYHRKCLGNQPRWSRVPYAPRAEAVVFRRLSTGANVASA